jgi:hypothetical protein
MPPLPNWFCQLIQLVQTVLMIAAQVMHRMRLRLRSRAALAAETLFFKKYLWNNIRGSQSFGTIIHND